MESCHIAFVILHYIVIDETLKCIEYIRRNITHCDYDIVVVDNASPNGSGKELAQKYHNDQDIHIILNNANLGFSKGNNIGFRYAKENFNCDFIVVMNNDLFIEDEEFDTKIANDYEKYGFAVLGPRIYTLEDKTGVQNPLTRKFDSDERRIAFLEGKIKDLNMVILLSHINADLAFYRFKAKLGRLLKKENRKKPNYDVIHKDVSLHGSIWIFSRKYFEKLDGLEEVTFMYNEEMLLFRQIQTNGLLSMYDPEIKVLHAEKAATMSIAKRKSRSRRIRYQRELLSAQAVVDYLRED